MPGLMCPVIDVHHNEKAAVRIDGQQLFCRAAANHQTARVHPRYGPGVRALWWTDKLSTSRTDAKRRQRTSSGQSMLMMLYWKKRKTFLGVKKAVGFPVFYRTLQTLAGQAFRRSSPSKRRTELVAGETKKPGNRRGFPFYSSGASNPKGSGAQYCSPPATVLGIETMDGYPCKQQPSPLQPSRYRPRY